MPCRGGVPPSPGSLQVHTAHRSAHYCRHPLQWPAGLMRRWRLTWHTSCWWSTGGACWGVGGCAAGCAKVEVGVGKVHVSLVLSLSGKEPALAEGCHQGMWLAIPGWPEVASRLGLTVDTGVEECCNTLPPHPTPPHPLAHRTRALRADYELTTRQRPPMLLRCKDAAKGALLASCAVEVATLTTCASMEVLTVSLQPPCVYALGCVHAAAASPSLASCQLRGAELGLRRDFVAGGASHAPSSFGNFARATAPGPRHTARPAARAPRRRGWPLAGDVTGLGHTPFLSVHACIARASCYSLTASRLPAASQIASTPPSASPLLVACPASAVGGPGSTTRLRCGHH